MEQLQDKYSCDNSGFTCFIQKIKEGNLSKILKLLQSICFYINDNLIDYV